MAVQAVVTPAEWANRVFGTPKDRAQDQEDMYLPYGSKRLTYDDVTKATQAAFERMKNGA